MITVANENHRDRTPRPLLRLPALVFIALAIAFIGGGYSASFALKRSSGFGQLPAGSWVAFPFLQTESADPYAKAHRASDGKLLMGQAEGLIFTAGADSDDRPLSGRCAYRLEGTTPPARFFTLRMIDDNGLPLDAPPGFPASLNSRQLIRGGDGQFVLSADALPHPGNWMRLDHDGAFSFVLTLIDTPAAGSAGITALDLPDIVRGACRDG